MTEVNTKRAEPFVQHVGGRLAAAVLRAGVGDQLHAEGGGVVVRGLLGVADGEDDRVHSLDREGVGLPGGVGSVVCSQSLQSWPQAPSVPQGAQ